MLEWDPRYRTDEDRKKREDAKPIGTPSRVRTALRRPRVRTRIRERRR